MDIQKRSTGIGAALILFVVLLRLSCTGLASPAYADRQGEQRLQLPSAGVSAIRTTLPQTTQPIETVAPATVQTQPPTTMPGLPPSLQLTREAGTLVKLRVASDCGYTPQLLPLLLQPLAWDLTGDAPTVLIYHSHASECYTKAPGQEYTELINCRTTDIHYNMVAVGDALAAQLTAWGISVIHDRQLFDQPSYNDAYNRSRARVEDYLQQYPSIRLVLDLHRDAAENSDGSRYATAAVVDGQPAAQLMLVVGTDYTGSLHPAWQENLALALKLQVILEERSPGITRSTILRGSRFNQDVSPGALIIEVGASGNTLQEALRTVPILAQAIVALQHGVNTQL